MLVKGLEYFYDIWNYLEIVPILCIWILLAKRNMFVVGDDGIIVIPGEFYNITAVIVVLLWMKVLFFMRLFRKTGYLVHSIITVVQDIGIFLIIFLTVMVAFSFSFLAKL